MGLFSSRSAYSLGVDFGTQSIKAVELRNVKGKAHLSNYATVNVADLKEVPSEYNDDYAKRLSDALTALFAQMKPKTKRAIVSIPSFNGLIVIVDFPRMKEKDIASAIKFESRKYIPASLEEVNVSWEILEETEEEKAKPTMKVLLVAAPKSEVQYYDGLFQNTGVQIESLELEAFSVVRSVIGGTRGRFVLVDIGARTTNVVLVQDSVVHMSRSVDVGGADVTTAIMEGLNISYERALALKEGGDNFFTGPTRVSFAALGAIANEVKRVLDTQKSNTVDSLVLSGGGAQLVGLDEYFTQTTGLHVVKGNPLSHVVYDATASGTLPERATSFAVAIGLALRDIEESKTA